MSFKIFDHYLLHSPSGQAVGALGDVCGEQIPEFSIAELVQNRYVAHPYTHEYVIAVKINHILRLPYFRCNIENNK